MRNPTHEQALRQEGVEYVYEEKVPLDDIDLNKGLRNQARLEQPLDPELVTDYATALRGGSEFPPVILWRPGKGRWIPIDGNHRLAAIVETKGKTVDAYCLTITDPMIADRLTWSINNLVNGKRLSKSECMQHAVSFCRKYSMAATTAAKQWGVSPNTLKIKLKALEAKDALDRQGVKGADRLSDDALFRLSPMLKMGEDVFAEAATVAIDTGMTADQHQEMAARVSRAKTSEDKLKVIRSYAMEPEVLLRKAETKGGVVKAEPLPRVVFPQKIRALLDWTDQYSNKVAALRPSKDKFKSAQEDAADLVRLLIEVFSLGSVHPKEDAI